MRAYPGTDTLFDKLERTRIVCDKPECTVNCAYTLRCYRDRYKWMIVGIWLAVVLGLLAAVAAIS